MANMTPSFSRLSDADLLAEVKRLAAAERCATAALIRSLAAVEERQLHLAAGYPSMHVYCTRSLHLSEHAAYGRIAAARAARDFPLVLDLLEAGAITLTTVTLLRPHLTTENHVQVLEEARHKCKHDVEVMVARLQPQPDVPTSVRKVAERRPRPVTTIQPTLVEGATRAAAGAVTPPRPVTPVSVPAVIRPIAPERYKLQLTISRDTRAKLQYAKDLLRHSIPTGDEAAIVDRALTVLIEHLEKAKFAATSRPRAARPPNELSRCIPAAVRRTVRERDGCRCAFVGPEGRCTETGFLEYHHRLPFAEGGLATVDNIELRCRAHNAYEADRWFGPMLAREAGADDYGLGLDRAGPSSNWRILAAPAIIDGLGHTRPARL